MLWITEAKGYAYYRDGNIIWATVDHIETTLVYHQPTDIFFWSGHPFCYGKQFWSGHIQTRGRQYNTKHIVITKMLNTDFPPNIFYQFCRLESLDITEQGIKSISTEDLSKAEYLKYLNLSNNYIEALPPSMKLLLPRLETIDLTNNKIQRIEGNTFALSVRNILLSRNNIDNWYTACFAGTTNLLELVLMDNDLAQSPNIYINEISNLENVDVSRTNISSIYIQFQMLKYRASGNLISQITLPADASSSNFKLLELDLSDNFILHLNNLTHFQKLEKLNLAFNGIENIAAEIFARLNKLKHLTLGGNNIKNINFGWSSLVYLDLSYNNFDSFEFEHLAANLEEIHLEGNNLTSIDTGMRRMAPKLTRIGLNNNSFDCQQLRFDLILIQFDGVVPVFNESIKGFKFDSIAHTSDVKGIGCVRKIFTPILDKTISNYIDNKLQNFEEKINRRLELHDNTISVVENSDETRKGASDERIDETFNKTDDEKTQSYELIKNVEQESEDKENEISHEYTEDDVIVIGSETDVGYNRINAMYDW